LKEDHLHQYNDYQSDSASKQYIAKIMCSNYESARSDGYGQAKKYPTMRRPNGRKSARKTGRYGCVTRRERIETDSAVKKVEAIGSFIQCASGGGRPKIIFNLAATNPATTPHPSINIPRSVRRRSPDVTL
jgi:hypothetical protein